MSKPNSAMGRSRDFGIPGGPGKGDKSRVTNQSAYAQNFDEINWGRKKPADVYAETDGEWPLVEKFYGEWKHIPDNLPPRAEVDLGGKVVDQIPITNDIIRE